MTVGCEGRELLPWRGICKSELQCLRFRLAGLLTEYRCRTLLCTRVRTSCGGLEVRVEARLCLLALWSFRASGSFATSSWSCYSACAPDSYGKRQCLCQCLVFERTGWRWPRWQAGRMSKEREPPPPFQDIAQLW